MTIVRFDAVTEPQYLDYIAEWEATGEKIVPMASDRRQRPFSAVQERWREDETEAAVARGFVPSTVYFAVESSGRIVGCLSYRHRLNERLRLNGGHIGYGIRPSVRRQGYGVKMLKAFLTSGHTGSTSRFLVTCDETNVGSAKVIEACGGTLEDKLEFEGEWTRRYWIEHEARVVEAYYNENAEGEWRRLDRHRIEFELTKRIVGRHLPQAPADVLDVGGGPGRYSFWLAGLGHRVTLLDLSPANIGHAKLLAPSQPSAPGSFLVGNALHLDRQVEARSYDVVLLMGPLYHLVDEADRIRAVEQALAALRPGGILVLAFISGYAPLIDALKNGPDDVRGRVERLVGYLSNGANVVSAENPGFTNAYFIHPAAIDPFMARFGLERLGLFNVESVLGPFENTLTQADEATFQSCLDLAMHFVEDPNSWATGEHFLFVGRKQDHGPS